MQLSLTLETKPWLMKGVRGLGRDMRKVPKPFTLENDELTNCWVSRGKEQGGRVFEIATNKVNQTHATACYYFDLFDPLSTSSEVGKTKIWTKND